MRRSRGEIYVAILGGFVVFLGCAFDAVTVFGPIFGVYWQPFRLGSGPDLLVGVDFLIGVLIVALGVYIYELSNPNRGAT